MRGKGFRILPQLFHSLCPSSGPTSKSRQRRQQDQSANKFKIPQKLFAHSRVHTGTLCELHGSVYVLYTQITDRTRPLVTHSRKTRSGNFQLLLAEE